MCSRFTADAKFVAVALLDASIRVLFFDTFKPYLTLYGHKLPVLSLSASSDGALLVSGGVDKVRRPEPKAPAEIDLSRALPRIVPLRPAPRCKRRLAAWLALCVTLP